MVAEIKPKAEEDGSKSPNRFDIVERLKVRSLYLTRGLAPKEIAAATGMAVGQVYSLVQREGWSKAKKANQNEIAAKADARTVEDVESVVAAVAIKSEELGIASLFKAGDVLYKERGEYWAKDVQSLSQAAKNFVGLARQARGLDAASADVSSSHLVFVTLDRIQSVVGPREEKVVSEIHELNTAEPAPLSSAKDNAIHTAIYKDVPAIVLESEDDGAF